MDFPDQTSEGVEAPEIEFDAAHMADFRAPDLGGGEDLADDVVSVEEDAEAAQDDANDPPAQIMGKDAFWTVFRAVFQIPGGIMPDFAPLAIQPEEESMARPASDACYDLLSIYYPRALMPMGDTFALIMTAAPFLMMKVQVVRLILADRKRRQIEAQKQAQALRHGTAQGKPQQQDAANENEPPANQPANSPMAWMDQEGAA